MCRKWDHSKPKFAFKNRKRPFETTKKNKSLQLTARDSICYKASMLKDRKEVGKTEIQKKGMQLLIISI